MMRDTVTENAETDSESGSERSIDHALDSDQKAIDFSSPLRVRLLLLPNHPPLLSRVIVCHSTLRRRRTTRSPLHTALTMQLREGLAHWQY